MTARVGRRQRSTKETSIGLSIDLDGSGVTAVSTGLPFYDHMLDQLGRHGGFDLTVEADGDLAVDSHHTVEDVAIALGEAFRDALGDKAGVRRFASGSFPLDEALVEVALDLSGRPFVVWEVDLPESIPLGHPPFDPQLAEHAVQSFATAAGITLHVTLRRGRNVHHIIEATFKGLARCLRHGARRGGRGPFHEGRSVKEAGKEAGKQAGPLVAVLDYGIGNLRSAEKALAHVGADAHLTADVALVRDAAAVVLPGVAAFGPCMAALRRAGLEDVALEAVASGRPFLGICIGMQMLFGVSDEDEAARGLGVIPGRVVWIPPGVKRPQMQWNQLELRLADDPLFGGLGQRPWVYFVHSLHGVPDDPHDVAATCDYGGPLNAAFRRGNVFATQFHPEKSGAAGLGLLANFAAVAAGVLSA